MFLCIPEPWRECSRGCEVNPENDWRRSIGPDSPTNSKHGCNSTSSLWQLWKALRGLLMPSRTLAKMAEVSPKFLFDGLLHPFWKAPAPSVIRGIYSVKMQSLVKPERFERWPGKASMFHYKIWMDGQHSHLTSRTFTKRLTLLTSLHSTAWSEQSCRRLETYCISFLLHSVYNNLPSPAHLVRWGLMEDPNCKFCGHKKTLPQWFKGSKIS